MNALARHTLLELHGCDASLLTDAAALRPLLVEAVRKGGGTIVTEIFHNFSPHGASGVVVIAESHVAIHTWPEHAYAAVDIFSCSRTLDEEAIRAELTQALQATETTSQMLERGCGVVSPS